MRLPDELRERVEELGRQHDSLDGSDYEWFHSDTAVCAAEIALEWAMELVCQTCGEPESSPGCNRNGEHPGDTYGTQPGFVARAEYERRKEGERWG